MWSGRPRTKIVATLGPACWDHATLAQLIQAGVSVVRLNMAHGSQEQHVQTLARVRQVAQELGQVVAVLADLAGPKIRIRLPGPSPMELIPDSQVVLSRGQKENASRNPNEAIPVHLELTHPEVLDSLRVGDRVLLADGTVALEVEELTGTEAVCRVREGGKVYDRQGINFPGVRLGVPALTPKDVQDAQWAAQNGVDLVGLSFVRAAEDVHQLRKLLVQWGSQAWVVAKIERPEALDHLHSIVQAADAVMVARGDLAVETDVAHMAVVQKRIIRLCNRLQRPVIVATQMLDSMQHRPLPARSEVTDVANAILDGADACMLSGETAVGRYPVRAVEMMCRIAQATEQELLQRKGAEDQSPVVQPITDAVVRAAVQVAQRLHARWISVGTHSGRTALALAAQRSPVPVLGTSDQEHVLRKLCLCWGVVPVSGMPLANSHQWSQQLQRQGLAQGDLAPGDLIVMLRGTRIGEVQNMLVVHQVFPE